MGNSLLLREDLLIPFLVAEGEGRLLYPDNALQSPNPILSKRQYREVGFSGVTAKDPQVIPRSDRFATDKREESNWSPATVELN
jgi:hypothetical protein